MEPYSSDDIKRYKKKKFSGKIPEVEAAAIVSTEGLPITSALPQGVDEKEIAAMTAALLSLSKRALIEIKNDDFDQLYIKGSKGYLLVMQAGPDMHLIVSTKNEVRLGLILLDCKRACKEIENEKDEN